jgi:hypothetical protein
MKIVINACYGGFGLSKEALALFNERSGTVVTYDIEIKRNDPILVEIVEQLGEAADNRFSELKVVEIPDDVQWTIEEYDGNEWIAEKHRTWNISSLELI